MEIKNVKTKLFLPPKISWAEFYGEIPKLPDRSILFVTSKILSLVQGRCIPLDQVKNKDELIAKEADAFLPRNVVPNQWVMIAIKNNLLMASAGIDESNANGFYILWPEKPYELAQKIQSYLRRRDKIKNLGVIITDSHTMPMRRGVLGVSIGYYGFKPLRNYMNTKDLFDRKFKMVQTNLVDSLATAAVMLMGEGTEKTPFAIATNLPFIQFQNRKYRPADQFSSLEIDPAEDLYSPLLQSVSWKRPRKKK